jgi:nucleoid DNA-binding protein
MFDKELIKKLSRKHNITQAQVEEMLAAQFKCIADVISKKSDRETYHFPSIRVIGLGMFHSTEYIKEFYKKKDLKKYKFKN